MAQVPVHGLGQDRHRVGGRAQRGCLPTRDADYSKCIYIFWIKLTDPGIKLGSARIKLCGAWIKSCGTWIKFAVTWIKMSGKTCRSVSLPSSSQIIILSSSLEASPSLSVMLPMTTLLMEDSDAASAHDAGRAQF
ncbi:unnamed protein product [Ixodes pacificus]